MQEAWRPREVITWLPLAECRPRVVRGVKRTQEIARGRGLKGTSLVKASVNTGARSPALSFFFDARSSAEASHSCALSRLVTKHGCSRFTPCFVLAISSPCATGRGDHSPHLAGKLKTQKIAQTRIDRSTLRAKDKETPDRDMCVARRLGQLPRKCMANRPCLAQRQQ
ncbi:unnamed protein product [Pleuronectes platessa]|uniref:Uncharacterized protein n=1 Tax=Pleuronectes platessa TaxID=8262 RepID=A0A9N7TR84_PLEPL|nr:unnamed protein product [Pleuronectes platessa]